MGKAGRYTWNTRFTIIPFFLVFLFPCLLSFYDQPLSFVHGMVLLFVVVLFLQRPPMIDPIEYAGKECRVSGNTIAPGSYAR
jgi:hypothetical protein